MHPRPDRHTLQRLAGLDVLIIEDEALVALNLETMLEELGCRVAATMMRFEQAERMLSSDIAADAAVLDVNIGGSPVFPLAEKLKARGVPIVFATGYGKSGIPENWRDRPILQKPYGINDLAQSLVAARESAGQSRT